VLTALQEYVEPYRVLQEAKVQLIDLNICNSSNWYAGAVHIHNVCAGYPQGGIDTCQVGAAHQHTAVLCLQATLLALGAQQGSPPLPICSSSPRLPIPHAWDSAQRALLVPCRSGPSPGTPLSPPSQIIAQR